METRTISGVCKHGREHQLHRDTCTDDGKVLGVAHTLCGQAADDFTRVPPGQWDAPPKGFRRCGQCEYELKGA